MCYNGISCLRAVARVAQVNFFEKFQAIFLQTFSSNGATLRHLAYRLWHCYGFYADGYARNCAFGGATALRFSALEALFGCLGSDRQVPGICDKIGFRDLFRASQAKIHLRSVCAQAVCV